MVVGTLDLKTVTLRYGLLWLKQAKDMTLFRITHQELFYTNASNPEQGLKMLIVLKRKVMSEIMTTFFPSILLTLITFATTLFKQIYFEASLSVNLTTMLVMTTIFISKMEGLPPTSETKMIDMWLILCQLVPFIEVILVTVIEFYKVDEKETTDMVWADRYAGKMDKDIPVAKEKAENSEMVAVGSGTKLAQLWNNLCEKHENEGIIVPHLHVIGKTLPVLVFLRFILFIQFQNKRLYRAQSSSWPSYTLLLQLPTLWIKFITPLFTRNHHSNFKFSQICKNL